MIPEISSVKLNNHPTPTITNLPDTSLTYQIHYKHYITLQHLSHFPLSRLSIFILILLILLIVGVL